MTIVCDKHKSLKIADEIVNDMIDIMEKKVMKLDEVGIDMGEAIYLFWHIAAGLVTKISFAIEGWGEIYGIENIKVANNQEIINKIIAEYTTLYFNENILNELSKENKMEH